MHRDEGRLFGDVGNDVVGQTGWCVRQAVHGDEGRERYAFGRFVYQTSHSACIQMDTATRHTHQLRTRTTTGLQSRAEEAGDEVRNAEVV